MSKTDHFSFHHKVVIVTGAGQGIGRVIAESFAKAGASVVISDIQQEPAKAVVKSIRANGMEAVFISCDLRKENDIKKLIRLSIKKYGRLDVVVNNARPRLAIGSFEDSFKEWDLGINVLLKAPALVLKYAIPHLIKSGKGNVINISSTNAFSVSHQPLAYHVAKAGLVQLSRYIAFQFGAQGVRSNVVCPGLVDISDARSPLTSNSVNKKVVELIVPLGRVASAQEVANVVLSLCSDDSSYVTGQVINVDGGVTLGDHFHIARKTFLDQKSPVITKKRKK